LLQCLSYCGNNHPIAASHQCFVPKSWHNWICVASFFTIHGGLDYSVMSWDVVSMTLHVAGLFLQDGTYSLFIEFR
jgi:hypothetical protein